MKRILVPVDFSDVSRRVVDTAVLFAEKFSAEIILLHVAEPEPDFIGYEAGPDVVRQDVAHDIRNEKRRLEELKGELAARGVPVTALQIQGPTEEKIVEEAERLETDLIVIGSHGHGALYNLLVGSVAAEVLKKSKKPVLVIPSAH